MPNVNPYGSYMMPLLEAVMRTDGPVLECGGGWLSTPLLHELVASTGRLVVTVEESERWFVRLLGFAHENHQVLHMAECSTASWDRLLDRLDIPWSVVFVDNEPNEVVAQTRYSVRKHIVRRALAMNAIVVVHDTEVNWFRGDPEWMDLIDSGAKNVHRYKYEGVPDTTVLSNV
jgi:hypothetical protein